MTRARLAVALALCAAFGCGAGRDGVEMTNAGDPTNAMLAALRDNGYDAVARALEERGEPSIRLVTEGGAGPGETVAVGATRLGGRPDLPPGVPWPEAGGRSLAFIAQVDLAEATAIANPFGLPREGFLYFFYDAEQSVWGFDPADRPHWRVLHLAAGRGELAPRAFPEDLPDHGRYKAVAARLEAETTYPSPFETDLASLGIGPSEEDALFEAVEPVYAEPGLVHRMFGHPETIQGDMQLQAQLVFHGLYCGDESGYNDPRAETLADGAPDWKLLMQVDSDPAAGMMWGDSGRLFYWMRERDMRDRAFENAWLILQCY